MKPELDYYDIPGLIVLWSEHDIKESDLLQYGASGRLQFSIWLSPPTANCGPISIECGYKHVEEDEFSEDGYSCYSLPVHTEKIYYGDRKLFKVSPKTADQLLNKKIAGKAIAIISLRCEGCSGNCSSQTSSAGQYINCDTDLSAQTPLRYNEILEITPSDLIVTIDEVKRFSINELGKQPEKPPYTVPTTYGYSSDLALAIEIWQAVVVERTILDKKSARRAGIAYIKKHHPELKCGETRKGEISTVALSGIAPTKEWSKFLSKE